MCTVHCTVNREINNKYIVKARLRRNSTFYYLYRIYLFTYTPSSISVLKYKYLLLSIKVKSNITTRMKQRDVEKIARYARFSKGDGFLPVLWLISETEKSSLAHIDT